MELELVEIPGLGQQHETVWKVRALMVNGRDDVTHALLRWKREHPDDYKAIMKVMRFAAQQHRVQNPKHVKRSANSGHGNAYEMIAYTGIARVMFFYDEGHEKIIVCTNHYQKSQGDQGAAFERCVGLRKLYFEHFK